MSFVNPQPGDVVYEQYAIVDTLPIKSGVSVTKGNVMTLDGDGYLIALTAGSGNVNNLNGVFQAMANSASVSGESDGSRSVQCLRKRSRIILKAPADVTKGDTVAIAATTNTVTADMVQVSNTASIGTVFDIPKGKFKTESGDLIEVDILG